MLLYVILITLKHQIEMSNSEVRFYRPFIVGTLKKYTVLYRIKILQCSNSPQLLSPGMNLYMTC